MIEPNLLCPIYNCLVHFGVGQPKKMSTWIMKTFDVDMSFENYAGRTIRIVEEEGDTHFIIYLKRPREIAAFSHEVYHLAYLIFETSDVKDMDEAMAYYIGYWSDRLEKIIKSKRLK